MAQKEGTITFTPTAADGAAATITVDGTPVASGDSISISVSPGLNTIPIVVTAEDGTTTKTYTVTVTRG
ncbi:hypothetical protein ES703_83833 [subsurface metagenome]